MKYAVVLATLATAVAAKPAFTNTAFKVEEGKPFKLTFTGCESGCTINLENGPGSDLELVKQLTADASGGSYTFTPSDLPSDSYAFQIIDNETKESNYSLQWEYEGSAATTTTSATSTSSTSTSSSSSSTSSSSTTTTTTTTITTASTTTTPTTSSTTTTTDPTSTGNPDSAPDSGVDRLASPLALVAGILAAMAYFN